MKDEVPRPLKPGKIIVRFVLYFTTLDSKLEY